MKILSSLKNKINEIVVITLLLVSGVVFIKYLQFLYFPFCWKLGYTLCAAIGEDFFAFYQAVYNFFHRIFIYGKEASRVLVTPYFMPFKYFPISPFIFGWPLMLTAQLVKTITPLTAYNSFLTFNILLHLLGLILIYKLAERFKNSAVDLALAVGFWLTYFPLNSEWRMGQFNYLASFFFFLAVTAIAYDKEILGAISWILSLAWKPLALLAFPYFWKNPKDKRKIGLILFFSLFIVFTLGYLAYFYNYQPTSFSDFLKTILNRGDRLGWEVHYIDNFSVSSLLGELFFNSSKNLWQVSVNIYLGIIIASYLYLSGCLVFKIKSANTDLKIYYLLFSLATMVMLHKEVWESWLVIWLPIIVTLLLLIKNPREKFFIFINSILLATPSLFSVWSMSKTNLWRFWLIFEKVLPQLCLYLFLTVKLRRKMKEAPTVLTKHFLLS